MRLRPVSLVLACAIAVVTLGLVACGSDDESAQATTSATTDTGTTTTESTSTSTTSTDTTTEDETGTTTEDETGTTTEDETTTRTTTDDDRRGGGRGGGMEIDEVVFRTQGNVAICGLEEQRDTQNLVCYTPSTGATVRLGPRAIPKARVVSDNRGATGAAQQAQVLARGSSLTTDVYRCTARRAGSVSCQNPGRHGFNLSKDAVFRF